MNDSKSWLNKIFLGEVASVHSYGAFIRVPGTKLQGLVHRSQVSKSDVNDVTEVLQKCDKVWCKGIKVTDDGKLSLSMKVVNQGSGADLDPNGVEIHQDEQRRKTRPPPGRRKKIELGAVLNTNCTKCGTRGHLAKDCFKDPSGKTYDLLPEEDEPVFAVQSEPIESELKSHKKSKKSKKKRKRSSSSSSSSSDEVSRKKKKKKEKKHSKSSHKKKRS